MNSASRLVHPRPGEGQRSHRARAPWAGRRRRGRPDRRDRRPCGQVKTFVLTALRRLGTPAAMDAALAMLTAQRWDPSLKAPHRF